MQVLLTFADDDKQLRQVAEVFIAQRVHHGQCGQGLAECFLELPLGSQYACHHALCPQVQTHVGGIGHTVGGGFLKVLQRLFHHSPVDEGSAVIEVGGHRRDVACLLQAVAEHYHALEVVFLHCLLNHLLAF